MLVLTRKIGQRVRLLLAGGEEIWLTVHSIRSDGGGIRLGIDAPRQIEIQREELLYQKEKRL